MTNLTDKQKELLLSNKEDLKAIAIAWIKFPSKNIPYEEDFDFFAKQFEEKKEVLFVTEDGVEKFTGDRYSNCLPDGTKPFYNVVAKGAEWNDYTVSRMRFHSEEAMREYVLLNSPKLSVNEVMATWNASHPYERIKTNLINIVKFKS